MRREGHRYRGVRRSSRGAGWGHRAVYVAAAIAAASLVAGFGLAGYWFGTFSHTYNQATASGFETAPYGVKFLSAGATYAGLIPNLNFTSNASGQFGPCANLSSGNTSSANHLNQSGARNATILSHANANNSRNASFTVFCLDAVSAGNISYLWTPYTFGMNNSTGWDNIGLAANNTTAPYYNVSLSELTGNTSTAANNTINITGCNPLPSANNSTKALAALANCPFFAGNNKTEYVPHAGFFNSSGVWINETTNKSPDAAYWHPNETGYLPSDSVFYAALEFSNATPNVTYEVDVDFAGATPLPQVFFVNTGAGGNETVVFLFDMSLAWTTGLPGIDYGFTNATGPFYSSVIASIDTFSLTVSQCYLDHSNKMACPDSLGGVSFP
jgi:hypothetical protein